MSGGTFRQPQPPAQDLEASGTPWVGLWYLWREFGQQARFGWEMASGVAGDLPAFMRCGQGVQVTVHGFEGCPLLWRWDDASWGIFSESLSCSNACEVLACRGRRLDTILSTPHEQLRT